jgi:hypothetical protein
MTRNDHREDSRTAGESRLAKSGESELVRCVRVPAEGWLQQQLFTVSLRTNLNSGGVGFWGDAGGGDVDLSFLKKLDMSDMLVFGYVVAVAVAVAVYFFTGEGERGWRLSALSKDWKKSLRAES